MDYSEIKSLMESSHGPALVEHIRSTISLLQDDPINPALPAEQFKVNALARQEAILTLKRIAKPFIDWQSPEVKKNLSKDNLYYSHIPKVPK